MLEQIEEEARSRNCCRVTLEVYENNEVARGLYEKFGFELNKSAAPAQYFMTKAL